EYVNPKNELRFGCALVPTTANGLKMNWNISKAGSASLELTHKFKIKNYSGAIRLLSFYTSANMGNYMQSIAMIPHEPAIENSRKYGRTKYGFGINAELDLSE